MSILNPEVPKFSSTYRLCIRTDLGIWLSPDEFDKLKTCIPNAIWWLDQRDSLLLMSDMEKFAQLLLQALKWANFPKRQNLNIRHISGDPIFMKNALKHTFMVQDGESRIIAFYLRSV